MGAKALTKPENSSLPFSILALFILTAKTLSWFTKVLTAAGIVDDTI